METENKNEAAERRGEGSDSSAVVRPVKCMNCSNCCTEPYNGQYDKRACFASEKRREKHFEKHGKSPDSYWMAPEPWIRVGSQPHGGCEFFSEKA